MSSTGSIMNFFVIFLLALSAVLAEEKAEDNSNIPAEQNEVENSKSHKKRGLLLGGYGGGFEDHGLELGGGNIVGHDEHVQAVTITKKVPYPVPHPVPYEVIKRVPVPYKVPVKVPVDRPYPVHVPKPYPVLVEKPYPVTVEKRVPYPVKVPVKVPYPVAHPVPVLKPYPVTVHKPYPVKVPYPVVVEKKIPIHISHHEDNHYGGLELGGFEHKW